MLWRTIYIKIRLRNTRSLVFDLQCPIGRYLSAPPKYLKTFQKRQILDSFELKEFADNNFKFDENGTDFSKMVENAVGKGEIARYEQFLLFPQRFQKTCTSET